MPGFSKLILPYLFPKNSSASAEEDCDAILVGLQMSPPEYVVDAFCGVGRHSIVLAKRGFSVSAIDISSDYINYGMEEAYRADLDIDFQCSDILKYFPQRKPSLIICLWNSFGHLGGRIQDRLLLKLMNGYLQPNGHLIIQVNTLRNVKRHFVPETTKTKDGVTVNKTIGFDSMASELNSVWQLTAKNGKKAYHEFKQTIYEDDELVNELRKAGFNNVDVTADLNGARRCDADKMTVFRAQK